jgi:hypothetical protein
MPAIYYNYNPPQPITPKLKHSPKADISYWSILKKYYLFVIVTVGALGLHEELTNPSTYLHMTIRNMLDHPTMTEYLLVSVKGMSLLKETIPEASSNMTLKDFLVDHVTNYWPCVFRELANKWPASQKWNSSKYLAETSGFETVMVDRSSNREAIPSFMKDYTAPTSMKYQDFLKKKNHYFIEDMTPPPSSLLPDIIEPTVTS